LSPDDDTRDPSRYAMVYEPGDSATLILGGGATPLNLHYSHAVNWGDNDTGFPHVWTTRVERNLDATPLCQMPQFDAIEGNKDLLSGEASLEMTPSGMFLQSTWNQWQESSTRVSLVAVVVLVIGIHPWGVPGEGCRVLAYTA
jgi:hypothetical protein